MKKLMMVTLLVAFSQSAFALNGSLLDNALNSNLKDKTRLQVEHAESQERPKSVRNDKLNAKYEVIEVGDEMGSFASARQGSAYNDAHAVEKKADAAKELNAINAEVSDSTL